MLNICTQLMLLSSQENGIIYKAFNYDRRKSNVLTDDRTNKKKYRRTTGPQFNEQLYPPP